MVRNYEELKEWRAKNATYNRDYMKKKRKQYKRALKDGIISYEDIPKSYRPRVIQNQGA